MLLNVLTREKTVESFVLIPHHTLDAEESVNSLKLQEANKHLPKTLHNPLNLSETVFDIIRWHLEVNRNQKLKCLLALLLQRYHRLSCRT